MGAKQVSMDEDTILEDFKRYQEVCERENKILLASVRGQLWGDSQRNSERAKLGGRPKGIAAWNKGISTRETT